MIIFKLKQTKTLLLTVLLAKILKAFIKKPYPNTVKLCFAFSIVLSQQVFKVKYPHQEVGYLVSSTG